MCQLMTEIHFSSLLGREQMIRKMSDFPIQKKLGQKIGRNDVNTTFSSVHDVKSAVYHSIHMPSQQLTSLTVEHTSGGH